MQANPTANRVSLRLMVAAACMLAIAASRSLAAQNAPAAPTPLSALQGFVLDSIHDGGLANAVVIIEGTGRTGITQTDGRFRVDSVPMGKHRIMVMHPLLDTLGVVMRTPDPFDFANAMHTLDLSLPSGERLAAVFCTPAQRQRSPVIRTRMVRPSGRRSLWSTRRRTSSGGSSPRPFARCRSTPPGFIGSAAYP